MALTIDTIRKFAIYDGKSTAWHVLRVYFAFFTTTKHFCIITMDKRQTDGKSITLEKACFVKWLQYLLGEHVNIVEIVTDAHVQIESYMSKY
jgi:hypothetical protein